MEVETGGDCYIVSTSIPVLPLCCLPTPPERGIKIRYVGVEQGERTLGAAGARHSSDEAIFTTCQYGQNRHQVPVECERRGDR